MVSNSEQPIMASSVIRGSAAALVIKFTASILGFVMFALASREMGLEAFGSVAIIFNAMSFLAVVALWGQETLIIRSWSEYCDSDRPGLARGALKFGALVVAGSGLLTALIVGVVWRAWDPSVSLSLLVAACSFLLTQSRQGVDAVDQRRRVVGVSGDLLLDACQGPTSRREGFRVPAKRLIAHGDEP